MRNLKKVLSLALALVMLLGMMVIGASATSFKDDKDIKNQEAAAVVSTIKVLKGDETGNFNPDATLDRASAAMVIAKLDLGVDAAEALKSSGMSPFTDVPASHWAAGVIEYCASQDYIKGDGTGKFNPSADVTGVQFGIMLAKVLGYNGEAEGLGGADWAVKGATLARKAGLVNGVTAGTSPMTRDDMAQMTFNALTAITVEYEGLNISINGVTMTSTAKARLHSTDKTTGSGSVKYYTYDNQPIAATTPIRLCEDKFPLLKLTTGEDIFGRVQSVWTWKGVEIKETKTPVTADHTFTVATKEADVKKAIGDVRAVKVNNADSAVVWHNGDAGSPGAITAKNIADLTGDGVVVEVYLNETDKKLVDKVVVVETTKADVTLVNSSKETFRVTFDTYKGDSKNAIIDKDSDFASLIGEVKKDDILAVVANKDGDVLDLFAPEVTEGYVTYVQRDNKLATVDGSTVKTYNGARLFGNTLSRTVKVYWVNEFALWVTGAKVKTPTVGDNYIYVLDIWTEVGGRNDSTERVTKVEGVLADGTKKTLTLADVTNANAGTKIVNTSFEDVNEETAPAFTSRTQINTSTSDALTAGHALFVDCTNENKFAYGNISGSAKTALLDKVYKYYIGKNTTGNQADGLVGKAVLVVPTTAEVSESKSGELRSSTATITVDGDSRYIADGVSMVWIDSKDNVVQTGRKTISGDAGNYYAVVEGSGMNTVTVIFVEQSTWISDDAVYVAHLYAGNQEYTDKNGATKKSGWKIGYYVNGDEEEKLAIVTSNPESSANGVPGFYTITENGEAFDLRKEGVGYTNKIAKSVDGGKYAILLESNYYNVEKAAVIDTRLDVAAKDKVTTPDGLMEMVDKANGLDTYVSLHLTNGAVDTVYIVDDFVKTATGVGSLDGTTRTVTAEFEESGSFKVPGTSASDVTKVIIKIGDKQTIRTDWGDPTRTIGFLAVFDKIGDYDGETLSLYVDGTKIEDGSIAANADAAGFVFYRDAVTDRFSSGEIWQIKCGSEVVAEGTI